MHSKVSLRRSRTCCRHGGLCIWVLECVGKAGAGLNETVAAAGDGCETLPDDTTVGDVAFIGFLSLDVYIARVEALCVYRYSPPGTTSMIVPIASSESIEIPWFPNRGTVPSEDQLDVAGVWHS